MGKSARSGSLLLGLLASVMLLGACTRYSRGPAPDPPPLPLPQPTTAPGATDKPTAGQQANTTTDDPLKLAQTKAQSAKNFSSLAQSGDDWKLVVSRWQQAVELLKGLPASHPQQQLVKTRLAEYERGLQQAQKQAQQAKQRQKAAQGQDKIIVRGPLNNRVVPGLVTSDGTATGPNGVVTVPIKRRQGGTPVIEVTFNGNQTFDMIVDTGASGTVITQQMANSLNASVVGSARVNTASQQGVKVPLAKVQSISVGGVQITDVTVAVGGPALEIGLLGHDFFGNFDVTVKQNSVEFRARG